MRQFPITVNEFSGSHTGYISGKISGHFDLNRPAFIACERRYPKLCLINPLDLFDQEKNPDWHDCMKVDLIKLLKDCDYVVLIDGWDSSNGATIEVVVALAVGIPIYDDKSGELISHIVVDKLASNNTLRGVMSNISRMVIPCCPKKI